MLREPELLFRRFEEDAETKSGARHKFQLLVTDLVKLDHPNASTVEGPGGRDWGVDTFVGDFNGALSVWQSKFVLKWNTPDPQAQVRSSFNRIVEDAGQRGFVIERWTLCVPCILSPDQQKWFDGWAKRMGQRHAIDVALWNGSEIRHRLLQQNARDIAVAYFPELVGRQPINRRFPRRSAYIEQVRDMEAKQLQKRDVELAELEAFCRGDETYVWWRGAPWSGKSALMATFVLHPPPGMEVVSFFITRRLEGQASGAAFTKAMSEQLADLVGETTSPVMGWEEVHFRQLLRDAADVCVAGDRKLVFVVDGLDEAQGKGIAAQLPKRPPPGVKVIVTSREHPKLPPDYLDDDHPLLRCRIRNLEPSEEALEVQRRAEWELREGILKDGSESIRHLLGLVVTARGLTATDLHDLTGLEPYKVEELAIGQYARTFENRSNPGYADDRVILLAHDELQTQAANALGEAKLAEYRQELHDWAAWYRELGWPKNTPMYLLHGYPRLLLSRKDSERLGALAADESRHRCLRIVTGADAGAISELQAALRLARQQRRPDLLLMARLALHLGQLSDRNADTPSDLPAAWARIGARGRAIGQAQSIADDTSRNQAQRLLVTTFLELGELKWAAIVVDSMTDFIMSRASRIEVASAIAAVDPARALEFADEEEPRRARLLALAARARASVGETDHARTLAEQAESACRASFAQADGEEDFGYVAQAWMAIDESRAREFSEWAYERALTKERSLLYRTNLLRDAAEALAAAGEVTRALQAANDAFACLEELSHPVRRHAAMLEAGAAYVAAGAWDDAAQLAQTNIDAVGQDVLVGVMAGLAAIDAADRAVLLASSIRWDGVRARELSSAAVIAGAGGHTNAAGSLVAAADNAVRGALSEGLAEGFAHDGLPLQAVVSGWLAVADAERATSLLIDAEAQAKRFIAQRPKILASVALGWTVMGDMDRARQLLLEAEDIGRARSDITWWVAGLGAIAKGCAAVGASARALKAAEAAEELSVVLPTNRSSSRHRATVDVARAFAAAGKAKRAIKLAESISDTYLSALAIAVTAEELAATADQETVRRLAIRAETISAEFPLIPRIRVYAQAMAAFAAIGDTDRCSALAMQVDVHHEIISDPGYSEILLCLIRGWAYLGKIDLALVAMHSLNNVDFDSRTLALAIVAEGAARDPEEQRRRVNLLRQAEMQLELFLDQPLARSRAWAAVAGAYIAAGQRHEAEEAVASALAEGDWSATPVGFANIAQQAFREFAQDVLEAATGVLGRLLLRNIAHRPKPEVHATKLD